MKKLCAWMLAMLLLLGLCACGRETGKKKPEKTTEAPAAVRESLSSEEIALWDLLEEASGLPVLAFYYDKFGGIAFSTAFALMGGDLSCCALWYCNNVTGEGPVEAAVYEDGVAATPKVAFFGPELAGPFGREAFLMVTRADGFEDVWGVGMHEPIRWGISGVGKAFAQEDNRHFTLRYEGKPYWFYFDSQCYEFGGREITKEQLLGCVGAAEILAGLADIHEIYYRGNGIINVNHGGGYVTLRLVGADVEEMERGTGSYRALMASGGEWKAMTPRLAGVFEDADFAVILAEQTDKPTLSFDMHDYDGDGTMEAFVLVGEAVEPGFVWAGDLWFVNKDGAQFLTDGTEWGWSWVNINEVYTFGKRKYMLITTLMAGDSSYAMWWTVKNGKPCQDETISGRGGISEQPEGNEFTMNYGGWGSAYEYNLADPEEGYRMGRTFHKYWFYYDGGAFHEYGGREITEQQLRRCAGAGKILDGLKAEGQTIGAIYYRGNGIININSSTTRTQEGSGFISYRHTTLQLKNGAVMPVAATEEWEGGSGSYTDAFKPEIAVYPGLPEVMR